MKKDYTKPFNQEKLGNNESKEKIHSTAFAHEKEKVEKNELKEKNNSKEKGTKAKVISNGKLNVRELPDKDSKAICQLSSGTQLLIHGVENNWAHVHVDPNIDGYVMAEFIKEI